MAELRDIITHNAARQEALAEQLARPAQLACYSPAAQAARQELDNRAASGLPVALAAAPGVDALSWAAAVHLASPRRAGMLLVVDATVDAAAAEPVDEVLARWADPARSPLALARGGTLIVSDAQLLPAEVQRYLGTAPTGETGLVIIVPPPLQRLVQEGRSASTWSIGLGSASSRYRRSLTVPRTCAPWRCTSSRASACVSAGSRWD